MKPRPISKQNDKSFYNNGVETFGGGVVEQSEFLMKEQCFLRGTFQPMRFYRFTSVVRKYPYGIRFGGGVKYSDRSTFRQILALPRERERENTNVRVW